MHSCLGAVGRGMKVLQLAHASQSPQPITARPTSSPPAPAPPHTLHSVHDRQYDNQSDTLRWSWPESTGSVVPEGRRRADRCIVARAPLCRCARQAKGSSELSAIHLRLAYQGQQPHWALVCVVLRCCSCRAASRGRLERLCPCWACMGNAHARAPHLVSTRVTASACTHEMCTRIGMHQCVRVIDTARTAVRVGILSPFAACAPSIAPQNGAYANRRSK